MSATGSMFIGMVGALVFLLGMLALGQRNWKAGCAWLLLGTGVIAWLTYLDKPSANLWP